MPFIQQSQLAGLIIQGAQGQQGSVGAQGVQGATGAQGLAGAQGVQGATGAQGVQGATGPQGDVGAQGVQGATGPQGVQGSVGAQGVQGATGAQGVQGATGPQGVQGATPAIGGSNTQIQFNNSGSLGGSANLVFDGTNVGIGTSSPYGLLNIKGSNGQLVLTNGNVSGGMKLTSANSNYTGNGYLAFEGYANEYGRFDSSGNFLLGTTSATANFNFVTSLSADTAAGMMIENTSNTVSASAVVRYKSSGSAFAVTGLCSPTRAVYGTLSPNVTFMYTGETAGMTFMVDANGPITFATGSSIAERMRIDSSGNVGIGTTAAGTRLVLATDDTATTGQLRYARSVDPTYYWETGRDNQVTGDFLFSNATGSTKTERMRITSAGNVGLGVTPSAWGSNYKAIQIGAQTALYNAVGYVTSLNTNAYEDSVGALLRIAAGEATRYTQAGGVHAWFTAANGSAGAVAAFTQAMTLDNSGNLGIGTTSPSTFGKVAIQVTGSTTPTTGANVGPASVNIYVGANGGTGSTTGFFGWFDGTPGLGAGMGITRESSGDWGTALRFFNHPSATSNIGDITERMRIDSSGSLLVGTTTQTSVGEKLLVQNSATVSSSVTMGIYSGTVGVKDLNFYSDGNSQFFTAARIRVTGGSTYTDEGFMAFWTTSNNGSNVLTTSEKMRITPFGNVGIGITAPTNRLGVYQYETTTGGLGITGSTWVSIDMFNANADTNARNWKIATTQSSFGLFELISSTVAGGAVNTTCLSLYQGKSLALEGALVQTGTGITFPATQSASSNANTLDDYEEGTWTPVFTGVGGTNPTVTYTAQVGTYTKIGNRVIYEITVITSAAIGGSGALAISLPFATSGSSNNYHIALVGFANLLDTVVKTGYTDPGRTDMFFTAANANSGNLDVSALTNDGSGFLMMQGQYLIG
jgi:hypothetical protein